MAGSVITVKGVKRENCISSNAGQFFVYNWEDYYDLDGYWEIWLTNYGRKYILRFTPYT